MKRGKLHCALALLGAAAALNLGCEVRGETRGAVDPPVVFTEEPTLVTVDSGVYVVRDADQPVYWVDDSYWVYRDNVWYRSNTYDGGWAVVEVNVVPTTIVHRDHRAYVHYHGAAEAQTRPAPRMPVAGSRGIEPPEHKASPPRREEGAEPRGVQRGEKRPDAETRHDDNRKPDVEKRPDEVKKPEAERRPDAVQRPEAVQRPDVGRKPDAAQRPPEVAKKPDAVQRPPDVSKKPDAVQKPDVGKKRDAEKKDNNR